MDRSRRARTSRKVRWQSGALLAVVAGDGVLLYILGAPAAVIPLYAGLGVLVAGGRLWLGRAPAPAPVPAEPEPEPPLARRAVGYVYVSNGELDEHSRAIAARCAEAQLDLSRVAHDSGGAGGDHARPALAWALEQLATGRADVLVVSRLQDLSANVANLVPLLRWFDDGRRTLIAIDLGIDTSTEAGRLAAQALTDVGGWEHQRLSERTRRGLEAARSNGRTAVADVPELQERIARMREDGMTLQAIADTLNEEGVPTLRGGAKWRPSSVQRATGYRRPSNQSRGIELPKAAPPHGQQG